MTSVCEFDSHEEQADKCVQTLASVSLMTSRVGPCSSRILLFMSLESRVDIGEQVIEVVTDECVCECEFLEGEHSRVYCGVIACQHAWCM